MCFYPLFSLFCLHPCNVSFFLPLLRSSLVTLCSWQIARINTYLLNDDFMLLVCNNSKISINPICFMSWFHNIKLSFYEQLTEPLSR